MKIGIDARTLKVKGGSKTYAINLLSNFKNHKDIILFGIDNFLDYKTIDEKTNQQNPLFRLYYDNIKLPNLLKKEKIDLFHGVKGIIPNSKKYKKVVTVLDLSSFVYPEFTTFKDRFYWKIISPKSIKKADHIITISQSTKKDLINILKIRGDKITVIYLGYNNNIFRKKDKNKSLNKLLILLKQKNIKIQNIKDKKIILNVNTISPRKNIQNLIKSFNIVAKYDKNLILFISGRKGWKTKKIFEECNKSLFKNRIYFLDYIPDNIVVDLYNISEVFVYSSIYEGFGLPILEAQACGCPVITSNVSSMPEVAGKGAILVYPYNVSEIASAMKRVIEDKKLRNDLIKKGFENCKKFSWEKCAKETLKVYKEVYNEK